MDAHADADVSTGAARPGRRSPAAPRPRPRPRRPPSEDDEEGVALRARRPRLRARGLAAKDLVVDGEHLWPGVASCLGDAGAALDVGEQECDGAARKLTRPIVHRLMLPHLGYRATSIFDGGMDGLRAADGRGARGRDLRHAARGPGPAAIFLHGGPGIGAEHIIGLVEEVDGLVNGVLPQQRGLYPSTLEGPRDVETHVADEIALLDQLGWERAWLIGHSWGGHLAMHIAVAHPEQVTGLILIETLGAVPDGGSNELVGEPGRAPDAGRAGGPRRAGRATGRRRRRPHAHGQDADDALAVLLLRPRQRPAARVIADGDPARGRTDDDGVRRGALRRRHPGARIARARHAGALDPR